MNQPLVSVIIPFYNHLDWLCEAIDSVLNQSYKNTEIIVVNDGSTEAMDDFLAKYGCAIKYIYKENGGPASARNVGIDASEGEFVAFLDSDDIWLTNKLDVQISEMITKDADWCCCDYQNFGQDNTIVKMLNKQKNQESSVFIDYEPDTIATPTVIVKREILKSNNKFRFAETMRYGQDGYLWIHLIADYKLLVVNSILAKVRIRGTNAGKRAFVQITVRAQLWKYRKLDSEKMIKKMNFSTLYVISNEMCCIGAKIVEKKSLEAKPKIREIISKVLYLVPYTIFKIDKLFEDRG